MLALFLGYLGLSQESTVLFAQDKEHGQIHGKTEEAFRNGCVDCHTVPDTKFETDRAWLNRIKDTA